MGLLLLFKIEIKAYVEFDSLPRPYIKLQYIGASIVFNRNQAIILNP